MTVATVERTDALGRVGDENMHNQSRFARATTKDRCGVGNYDTGNEGCDLKKGRIRRAREGWEDGVVTVLCRSATRVYSQDVVYSPVQSFEVYIYEI